SPTPGFKQPRRLAVQWVSARPDSPHAKKAAEIATATLQAVNPASMQLRLLETYDRSEKYRHPLPAWTEPSFILPHYVDPRKPENIAATVCLLAGSANSQTSVLPAILSYQAGILAKADKATAEAAIKETQRRLPIGTTLFLAG